MQDVTTINLERAVVKQLALMRTDGETYNDVVVRLIQSTKAGQLKEVAA